MSNPQNRSRDDRRMHEGEKPGLSEKHPRGDQEPVELERADGADEASATTDREQESALGGNVATRSKA